MFSSSVLLLLGLSVLSFSVADPIRGPRVQGPESRVVGGTPVAISLYPFASAMLFSMDPASTTFTQYCGGSIINARYVLSAAQCYQGRATIQTRFRVGSANANSGGDVYNVESITTHPSYNAWTLDSDVALVRSTAAIAMIVNTVAAASIAGSNYAIPDETTVNVIGWGRTESSTVLSEQLRHGQVSIVNHWSCMSRYGSIGWHVSDNMICSGLYGVGGVDQCDGDAGSPIVHSGNIIVGIRSFGFQCGLPFFPGVGARVPRFQPWITAIVSQPTE